MTAHQVFETPKPWFSVPFVHGGFQLFVDDTLPGDTFLTAVQGCLAGQDLDYWTVEPYSTEDGLSCWLVMPLLSPA